MLRCARQGMKIYGFCVFWSPASSRWMLDTGYKLAHGMKLTGQGIKFGILPI